ncbi:uncharacterized protein KY384_007452 [Bacidia gigantensis]|uniref:uncharacterized protein n=1 Tax=Bacidia gigantensis TaxID=2732470 RepID=UPI001D04AB04|nr:uncharacterized protein KY384_007452 [Bacidia gigantensis]KAG8528534.1 hypothetical protein KY384_007452 [Bacidia gigantensis]
MAPSNGVEFDSHSAASLLDPKRMKAQLNNGNSASSFESPRSPSTGESTSAPSADHYDSPYASSLAVEDYAHVLSQGYHKSSEKDVKQKPTSVSTARQLLDPKEFGKSNRLKRYSPSPVPGASLRPGLVQSLQEEGKIDGPSPSELEHGDKPRDGQGSYIERLHGILEREERPSKKQKRTGDEPDNQDSEKKGKATFSGGKGGELGEYVKEKKKEGLKDTPVDAIVDLTGADDEEEIVVMAENSAETNSREVCYGRLDNTKVNAHQLPSPSGKAVYLSPTQWPSMKVALKRLPGKDNIIRVLDPQQKDFGTVDARASVGLARIMDSQVPKFRTQARLNARKRNHYELQGQDCSEMLDMVIILYGPKNKAESIGKWLSQKQIYLRTPHNWDHGLELCNPHAPPVQALPRTSNNVSHVGGSNSGFVTRTVEEIRSDVTGMFDSLQQSEDLAEVDPDPRITTELMSHQKQGLYFLQNKEKERTFGDKDEENNSLWRLRYKPNGTRSYYHVITGHEERQKPPEVRGGILADMMGLGKTLSILSLVVGSLDNAEEWAKQIVSETDGEKPLVRNSRTTLLVAPLSTLANWEDQIRVHIKKSALTYYVYHGGSRICDIDELAKYDMVVTTYSIVSSDFTGRGNKKKDVNPLLHTNFFRIVLDEAHMIREQATRQSQAICALSAQRRWAVTGTPVQNRLEDLGALIKFLRVRPFSDKGGFAQHILAPCKNSDPDIIPKLRLLVDSFTLRRLKDRIDLPERHDHVVRLKFTEDEQRLYDWFAKDSRQKLQVIANDKLKSLGGRTYAHILRAIMRLRLICAHGRELLSDDDLKITEGFSKDNAIDLDDENLGQTAALTPRQAYEMLMLAKETGTDTCISCTRTVEPRDDDNDDGVIGCMLPCYQLLCRDCMAGVKASLLQESANNHFKCPFCQATVPTSFFELTKDGIDEAEDARAIARQNPRQAKVLGRYGGPHTKVTALLEELRKSSKESESLESGAPIKSVVFSGWTVNLDLIQIALEDNGMTFVRLDGKMSRKNRNASLDAFQNDPKVRVILISINAGGLGLNLTSASKVYVMEPQFNPAAEAQAVDRVHRLGQKREVFISHYIMEDSFEEKMLELQRRKQALADMSMNRGKMDKAEAAKRKLDDLRSLFK